MSHVSRAAGAKNINFASSVAGRLLPHLPLPPGFCDTRRSIKSAPAVSRNHWFCDSIMGRLQASETLARAAIVATLLCAVMAAGCGAEKFSPRAAWQDSAGSVDRFSPDRFGDLAWRRFAGQFSRNRSLPPELLSRVVVLNMLPRYSPVEQIRHGNMGHVAIEIDHRLYDMGALNGYAYVFRANPAVRKYQGRRKVIRAR